MNTDVEQGADTFIPFSSGKLETLITETGYFSSTTTSKTFNIATLLPNIYNNLTTDNFLFKINSVYSGVAGGAHDRVYIYPTLSYNSTTGTLTLSKCGHSEGNGSIAIGSASILLYN